MRRVAILIGQHVVGFDATVWEAIQRDEVGPYSAVGRWWYGKDEIDIIGLAPDTDHVLLAKCKWTTEPVGHALVAQLRAKAERVRWGPEDREEEFALFSKSGFVDELAEELSGDWTLFGLSGLGAFL